MREILFRAKREDNKEWVYGGLITYDLLQKQRCLIISFYVKLVNFKIEAEQTSEFVIPETIGQFTGLTDKNGAKIFEGDIVQYQIDMINLLTHEMYIDLATSKIEFYNGSFTIYENGYGNTLLSEKHKDIEVIGNIHERGNDD